MKPILKKLLFVGALFLCMYFGGATVVAEEKAYCGPIDFATFRVAYEPVLVADAGKIQGIQTHLMFVQARDITTEPRYAAIYCLLGDGFRIFGYAIPSSSGVEYYKFVEGFCFEQAALSDEAATNLIKLFRKVFGMEVI